MLLWGLRSDLFLFGASQIILTSQRTCCSEHMKTREKLKQEVVCARKMSSQGLRFSWEGSCQSAVHTLCCLFLC